MMERPRADMPGFVPWEGDGERMEQVEKHRRVEARSRKAMRKQVAQQER